MSTLPLWKKELRELRPWAALSLVVGLIDPVSALFEQLDLQPLSHHFTWVLGHDLYASWLLAYAVGTGVAVRERDDGTLAFLDGLPVTRWRAFITRCAVALAVVSVGPVVQTLGAVVLHLLSRGSLDHAVHPVLLGQALALALLLVLSGLSTGAALGGLRSLTWLMTGVVGTGLALLIERVPAAAVLNPLSICEVEVGSTGLAVDPALVWTQLGLSALSLLIAWRVFDAGTGARLLTLARRPVLGAIATTLTIASMLALAWAMRPSTDDDDEDEPKGKGATFAPGPPAELSTAHYRFSYPANRSRQVLALADRADAIFERVHALLHTPPGTRIDVDASGSQHNTAGTAFADGLRLNPDEDDLDSILAHETTHVVARRLAGDAQAHLWDHATILNEGLATWVERHFEADTAARDEGRLVLAALRRRGDLPLPVMADRKLLGEHDELLKYPVGEAVIEAVVSVAGEAALPLVVAAFADPKLPQDLDGLELWRVVFQTAGVDPAAVLDALGRDLEREERGRAELLDALPRPRARVVTLHEHTGAQVLLDEAAPEGWRVVLRFRPSPDSGPSTFERVNTVAGEVAWRTARSIRARRVCLQAGLSTKHQVALFEPWRCLSVAEATPLEDWAEPVMARLLGVRPQLPLERPTHVASPHEGVFGAEAASAWPTLDELGTQWRALGPGCNEALRAGKPITPECTAVLERALAPVEQVTAATGATRAGDLRHLEWTSRDTDTPMGPRLVARALAWQAALALERKELDVAAARCLDGLALARDLEWGGDAALADTATSVTGIVMPACLRVVAQRPGALEVGALEHGLAPTLDLLENERAHTEARLFSGLLPEASRAALPQAIRDRKFPVLEVELADQRWFELQPAWRAARAAAQDGVPLLDASRFDRAHVDVPLLLGSRACRLGLLALPRLVANGGEGDAPRSVTVGHAEGALTLEVHCGLSLPWYGVKVAGAQVEWQLVVPE